MSFLEEMRYEALRALAEIIAATPREDLTPLLRVWLKVWQLLSLESSSPTMSYGRNADLTITTPSAAAGLDRTAKAD